MEDNLLTLPQVRERLQVSYNTLNRYIKQGEIVVVRISKSKRFITEQALQDFLKQHTGTYLQVVSRRVSARWLLDSGSEK